MRLRRYTAPTMDQAMAMVRDDLGRDAIIVGHFSLGKGKGFEVTAAIEELPDPGDVGDPEPLDLVPARAAAPVKPAKAKAPPPKPAKPAKSAPVKAPRLPARSKDDLIAEALTFHTLPRQLAEQIFTAASAMDIEDPVLALAGALDGRLSFRPLPAKPLGPMMLVGPAGAGKTVTAAKIAAKSVLAGQPIHVITTDTVRAGAVAQIEAFTKILEMPLTALDSPDGLKKHLNALPLDRPAVIDTAGTNILAPPEVKDIARFMKAAGDAEIILVLGAGGDPFEAAEAAALFRKLGARRLIVTRIDACRRLGAMIAAADSGGLPLAHISITPYVSQGLAAINPVSLARLLLRDPETDPTAEGLRKATE